MALTKKAKLEQFDALNKMHDLLIRYFWDDRDGVQPEPVAKYRTKDGDKFKASLYRTDLASGGYIVIDMKPGMPSIYYYEDWTRTVADLGFYCEYNLAMKSLAEQLRHVSVPVAITAA